MTAERSRLRSVLVWFVLALVVIQTFGGLLLLDRQRQIHQAEAEQATVRELDLLATLIREPLLRHDYSTVLEFLHGWREKNPGIRQLRLIAANGFALADYQAADAATGAVFTRNIRAGPDAPPADGAEPPLATLVLERDIESLPGAIKELRRQLLPGGILITLLLGGILWLVLYRLGLRPLAREIGRRKEVELELREDRDQLDKEVARRTLDLERANQALRDSESALKERSDRLKRLNDELQELIYVIAHDLKGPLRAVSHLATLLEEEYRDTLPSGAQPYLEKLRSRVKRMHALIEALLAYSEADHGGHCQQVDCAELLEEILEVAPVPPSMRVVVERPLPTIATDREQLRQVLAQLIGNAVAHHDRTDGEVRVAARELDGRFVEFSVSDDGPGIAPEYHDKVFGLFQTLEIRSRRERTGMGLTLVKKIVESRGGEISIDSRGRGTALRFTWPRQPLPLAEAAA